MENDIYDSPKKALAEDEDLNSPDDSAEISLDENEPENFFFESDHLALRGNADYQNLLRAYIMITAQKDEMLKNYDVLNSALSLSQQKPGEFVQDLRTGKLKLPERIKSINIPKIDFQKYENNVPDSLLTKAKNIYTACKNEEIMNETKNTQQLQDLRQNDKSHKLWTVAEQRRLEELLVEYPPEEIEMRRFAKIAKALGNRTTKQVASRLQKYFLKLHKAGLPVPGRLPRSRAGRSRGKHSVFNGSYSLMRPSTFFPTLNIPTGLQSLKNQDMKNVIPQTSNECASDLSNFMDDEVTESESNSDGSTSESELTVEKSIFRLIKRVYKDKQKDDTRPSSIHVGYTCDYCKESPITGTRWHCMDCLNSTDFCSDCLVAQTESSENIIHPLSHNLAPFRSKEPKFEKKEASIINDSHKNPTPNLTHEIAPMKDEEFLEFTNDTESDYIEYLAKQFQDQKITPDDYLKEMVGLNFGAQDLNINTENGLVQINCTEFFKDKIVKNVIKSKSLVENIFNDEQIDGKLLKENEKLKLNAGKCVIKKELLDHDYSFSAEFEDTDIKEEYIEPVFDNNDSKQICLDGCNTEPNFSTLGNELFDIGREESI